jgi:hypothetical protein
MSHDMESGQPDPSDERWRGIPLDDEHAHLLLEYDERVVVLSNVIQAIEGTAAAVVGVRSLRGDSQGTKAVLVTIETQDIRPVLLRLSSYPLARMEGYNARTGRQQP